jgi:hypothetical protein
MNTGVNHTPWILSMIGKGKDMLEAWTMIPTPIIKLKGVINMNAHVIAWNVAMKATYNNGTPVVIAIPADSYRF